MENLDITLPEQGERIKTRLPEPDREMFDELKDQYNFSSDAEAGRFFLQLGMRSTVDNDPRHTAAPQTDEDFSPVTIRELVPTGTDNAVDMTGEFWEEILRSEMPEIVTEDPEIKRDGYDIYR